MPRIRFIADPERFDTPPGEHYEAGQTYDLTADQANRWKSRGIAVDVPPEPSPEPETVAMVETAAAVAEAAPVAAMGPVAAEQSDTATPANEVPQETASSPEPMEGEIPFSTAARRRK
jgi:hypothetical protein